MLVLVAAVRMRSSHGGDSLCSDDGGFRDC